MTETLDIVADILQELGADNVRATLRSHNVTQIQLQVQGVNFTIHPTRIGEFAKNMTTGTLTQPQNWSQPK